MPNAAHSRASGPRASIEDRSAVICRASDGPEHYRRKAGRGTSVKEFSPVEGVHTAEAVIDNGQFGMVTIKFENGRIGQLAAGSSLPHPLPPTLFPSTTPTSPHSH